MCASFYRCVTRCLCTNTAMHAKFARASHQESPFQVEDKEAVPSQCIVEMHLDAHTLAPSFGCIHTSGKFRAAGRRGKVGTTKTPNPIPDGFNGKHNILQVNIERARCITRVHPELPRASERTERFTRWERRNTSPGGPLPPHSSTSR